MKHGVGLILAAMIAASLAPVSIARTVGSHSSKDTQQTAESRATRIRYAFKQTLLSFVRS